MTMKILKLDTEAGKCSIILIAKPVRSTYNRVFVLQQNCFVEKLAKKSRQLYTALVKQRSIFDVSRKGFESYIFCNMCSRTALKPG